MTHVLELLHGITMNEPAYAFLDDSQRQQAVLAAGGTPLPAQDADHAGRQDESGAPRTRPTRITLSRLESAHVLKFLMTIFQWIVTCIEGGLKWLDDAKITGMGKTNVNGERATNPTRLPEIYWARFYELTNSKPVFPGRDGILYNTFAEMAAENHVGYDQRQVLEVRPTNCR